MEEMMMVEMIEAVESTSFAGSKQKGEYVEALFLVRMLELGYTVCKPWGDSARSDFVIFKPGRRALRVQVKSAWVIKERAFHVVTYARDMEQASQWRRYSLWDTDFLVAYVAPHQMWYVMPIGEIEARTLCLAPHRPHSRGRYERYREAWELLDRAADAKTGEVPKSPNGV
jgi:PD-(D/E)XK nuclease superfamily protein